MSNIVSYSLWGDQDLYYEGAYENIDLVKEYYPGFITRFYCSPSIPDKWHNKYTDNGAEVVVVEDAKDDWTSLFLRFYACEEDGVVLIRDTDSRISHREYLCVKEWLNSRYNFHIIKDHVQHTVVPILGGTFSCRNNILKNIKTEIKHWGPKNKKGDDQDFLSQRIWRFVRSDSLTHCRFARKTTFSDGYVYDPYKFFGKHAIKTLPGPVPEDGSFVGEIVK